MVDLFIDLGVNLERFELWGEGEFNLIVDNIIVEGRVKNCRVEIIIFSF